MFSKNRKLRSMEDILGLLEVTSLRRQSAVPSDMIGVHISSIQSPQVATGGGCEIGFSYRRRPCGTSEELTARFSRWLNSSGSRRNCRQTSADRLPIGPRAG